MCGEAGDGEAPEAHAVAGAHMAPAAFWLTLVTAHAAALVVAPVAAPVAPAVRSEGQRQHGVVGGIHRTAMGKTGQRRGSAGATEFNKRGRRKSTPGIQCWQQHCTAGRAVTCLYSTKLEETCPY